MEEKVERPLMSEDEFKEYIGAGLPRVFEGVRRFRSIRRAMKRGHIAPSGIVYPNRPFNNRKSSAGRRLNEDKKVIYEQLKHRGV